MKLSGSKAAARSSLFRSATCSKGSYLKALRRAGSHLCESIVSLAFHFRALVLHPNCCTELAPGCAHRRRHPSLSLDISPRAALNWEQSIKLVIVGSSDFMLSIDRSFASFYQRTDGWFAGWKALT